MPKPRLFHALALTALVLIVWVQPAGAQDWLMMLWSRARAIMVMSAIGFLFVQGAAIFGFAQLLRLSGGLVATLLAMILGVVLSVIAAIPVALVAAMMPLLLSQVIVTASTFACGGLAIKITFNSTFGLGVLVYVLASTVTMICSAIALVLVF